MLQAACKKIKLNQSGIGLVEVIAALGVSVIAITALVSLALFTVRSSLQSKLTLESSKIATREMETIRAFRDSRPWADFITGVTGCSSSSTGCHMNPSTIEVESNHDSEIIDHQTITWWFNSNINVNPSDTNVVYISVTVQWDAGGQLGTKQTNLYTYFTNWRGF